MGLVAITVGGMIGSWAFKAGNAVAAGMSEEARRKRKRKAYQEAYKPRRRELYAQKRAAEIAARQAEALEEAIREAEIQGGVLIMANGEIDKVALEGATKRKRKPRVKSAVPMVRTTSFAAPIAQDSISRDLAERLGLQEIRQMVFAGVWQLTHHRDDPAPDRYDTAWSWAVSEREAFQQLLALAGVDDKLARVLKLTYEWVGDPLTLMEKLEELGFGRFEATTGEILLPLTPNVRRQILGH